MNILVSKDSFTDLKSVDIAGRKLYYYTQKSGRKETPNEDALLIQSIGNQGLCVAVADGVGSTKESYKTSAGLLKQISSNIESITEIHLIKAAILQAIERINHLVVKAGGPQTTLTLALIMQNQLHMMQVGDSALFICGQRGKLKYRTTMHSPMGYAVESGLMSEWEAQRHPDNRYVDNVVGFPGMKIEVGTAIELDQYDTVMLATDGVFDNFTTDKLIEIVDHADADNQLTENLIQPCQTLYTADRSPLIHKDDDITFIVVK